MHDEHDHDRGLAHDLMVMRRIDRRQAMRWLAGAALLPLVPAACAKDDEGGTDTGDTGAGDTDTGTDTAAEAVTACEEIPPETEGPYPGDGSNGPNALTLSGIVRSDIRTSIGNLSGTAAGIPLTIRLTLVDAANACAPLAGYAVYLWHCDRDGNYSMYTITDQNYLRGVQAADADGVVTFQSIFPACYSGRWPHIHFEIYPSVAATSSADNYLTVSQLALPEAECDTVFATAGYEDSITNLARVSLDDDNVFRDDGAELQLATMSGDVASGYVASLVIAIDS